MAAPILTLTKWFDHELGSNEIKRFWTCQILNVKIAEPNQQITWANNLGEKEKSLISNADVKTRSGIEAVTMYSCSVSFFPVGLDIKFPNLVALEIKDSKLRKLEPDDLKGFNKLKGLWLSHNKIRNLPDNLFVNQPLLEIISFKNNCIETISEHLLAPLKDLKFCDMRDNINIDMCFNLQEPSKGATLDEMNQHIKLRCQSNKGSVKSYVQQLWEEGSFSDFEIKVGSKKFKVHKSILSVNSPVFAAKCELKMEANKKKRIVIVNFPIEVVEQLLEFIYLRKIPDNGSNFLSLYSIAVKYQVEELKEIAQRALLNNLAPDNAYQVFLLAHTHNDEVMKLESFSKFSHLLGVNLPKSLVNHPDRIKKLLKGKAAIEATIASTEKQWSSFYKQLTNVETE